MLKKIKKGQFGISLNYQLPPLSNYTIKQQSTSNIIPSLKTSFEPPKMKIKSIQEQTYNMLTPKNNSFKTDFKQQAAKVGTSIAASALQDKVSDMFGDSEIGRSLGGIFSQGISSASDTITNNIIKGKSFLEGAQKNAGASVAGAAAGLGANLVGKGINALGGDSRLSRGIGQGVATGLGTIGGQWASNLVSGTGGLTFGGSGLFSDMSKMQGAINPYALGASVLGSAIGAAAGPSKEYSGKYGSITQGMDTAYDMATAGVNFIPGIGQGISAAMVLNKGLSNIFGSTDGMTKTDAILGSAFMPAPVKWLNMWGSSKTGTFNNQSWQNQQKADSFMGNAFGNLGDKFNQAREEAGKTYGTFSQGAKREAQRNLNFANQAWNQILAMADQNELQNIRSQVMSSINNQRYAQNIQGGWSPIARGKYGMKILNNATNHNIGMRLLSGAALIDNKQMILCNVPD